MHAICTIALGAFIVSHLAVWLWTRVRAGRMEAACQTRAQELKRAYLRLEAAHHRLKTTQDRLIQSEKLASLGQLTAGIAHELKNPLNFVTNFAALSAERVDDLYAALDAMAGLTIREARSYLDDYLADLRLSADRIVEHGRRADGIIHSMMQHASHRPGERTWTAVNGLVEEYVVHACHSWQARQPGLEVRVEREYDPGLEPVNVVPQEIGRVVLNLLSNAFDAVQQRAARGEAGYVPTVTLRTRQRDGGVEVRVIDNGIGMAEETRRHAFQPFFTTKPTGAGAGLGLSISFDVVVTGYDGQLVIASEEGRGTTVLMRLPTRQPHYVDPLDSTMAILQRARHLPMPMPHTASLVAS